MIDTTSYNGEKGDLEINSFYRPRYGVNEYSPHAALEITVYGSDGNITKHTAETDEELQKAVDTFGVRVFIDALYEYHAVQVRRLENKLENLRKGVIKIALNR